MRLGQAQAGLGHYDLSQAACERSLKLSQEINFEYFVGAANWHLGELALAKGQWAEAYQLLEESLAILSGEGARRAYAQITAALGFAALRSGPSS